MSRVTARFRRLERDLERRFRTAATALQIGGRDLVIRHPASAEDLISEHDFVRDERLPYWADLWPSARVLAEVVIRMSGEGKSLLELGCGSGLVATAAAAAGFDVHATDYYADALRFTRLNVFRNTGREADARHLDWRRVPPGLRQFDVVVASDVLYERPYAELVARTISVALAPKGIALVADPGRVAVDDFVTRSAGLGLPVRNIEAVPFREGPVRQTIRIYEFARR